MTEKEKMLNGELYMPENDETLFNERMKCKTLCYQFNNLLPDKFVGQAMPGEIKI